MDKVNAKILIVEDDQIVAEDIKNCLENFGFSVAGIVSSGEKALKKIEEFVPDLLLMDIMLKGEMDGIEVACQIRSRLDIPVVYLTANTDKNVLKRAKMTDPFGYIIKPFGDTELRTTIEIALYKHKMESRLKKSEAQFRHVIEKSPVPMAITDAEGNMEHINDKFIELFGWTTDDVRTPEEWWNAAYPDEEYRKKVQISWEKAVEKANATGKEIEVQQWRLTCKNGDLREVEFKMVPVSEDLNVITMNDITEHKRAEEQLEKHRQHLESLVEEQTAELTEANDKLHAELVDHWQTEEMLKLMALFAEMNPAPVLRCNKFGIVLMANPAAIKILGMKEEKGMLLPSVLPGAEDIEIEKCILNNEIISHSVMVGERFYHFVIRGSNEMDIAQIYGSDITDLKRVEEELIHSKDQFQGLVETTSDWVWEVDENAVYTYASPKIYDILGYKPDEIMGKTPFDFMPPDEAKRIADIFNPIVAARKPFTSLDNCNLHKNGEMVVLETSGVPFFDSQGQFRGYRGMDRDITGRKKAEENLLFLEKAIETTHMGITIVDLKGEIIYSNPAEAEMHGYSPEELTGKDARILSPLELWEPMTLKKIKKAKSMSRESVNARKDGSTFPVHLISDVVRDASGKPVGLVTACKDITDRKKSEEQTKLHQQQLIHTDKMRSLGTLVSGVAHEINNPNNFITLNSQTLAEIINSLMPILEEQYDKQDEYVSGFITMGQAREKIPELLAGIKDGSDRIQQTVKKLKNFARKGIPDYMHDVNINSIVKSAIEIVESLIRKSTSDFSVAYGDNLPLIKGNQQELEQVIINLITNACQALPDNNRGIAISTLNDAKSKKVMVKVSDEGTGIPGDILDNIMEPFVTTKRDSGGTGLGLSISFSIVQNHKGTLKFNSKVGKGTEATVTLPAMEDRHEKGRSNVK